MWLVVGGKVSNALIDVLETYNGKQFQGINNIMDVTNTILTKGLGHFKDVKGVIVLTSGCDSVVDLGWMLQLNRLNVPVLYYSNYETIQESDDVRNLANIHMKTGEGILIKEIVRDMSQYTQETETVVTQNIN